MLSLSSTKYQAKVPSRFLFERGIVKIHKFPPTRQNQHSVGCPRLVDGVQDQSKHHLNAQFIRLITTESSFKHRTPVMSIGNLGPENEIWERGKQNPTKENIQIERQGS